MKEKTKDHSSRSSSLGTLLILGLPENPSHSPRTHKNTEDNKESECKVPRLANILLIQLSAHSPGPPLLPPRILRRLRLIMPPRIKMINRILIQKRQRILLRSPSPSIRRRSPPRRTPMRRPPPRLIPIPPMRIETRRRPPKRPPPFTQPARGAGPRIRCPLAAYVRAVAAVAAHWVLTGVGGAVC